MILLVSLLDIESLKSLTSLTPDAIDCCRAGKSSAAVETKFGQYGRRRADKDHLRPPRQNSRFTTFSVAGAIIRGIVARSRRS